jgi:DNA-binding phage protein
VAAKWESGRRTPSAKVTLQACRKMGIDVHGALETFHASSASLLSTLSDRAVAQWLCAHRSDEPLQAVAGRAGLSRFQVTRCLSGETSPSLPVFFALIDALTGRLPEFVAALVPIDRVPALMAAHRRQEAARTCAYAFPWSSAVLALLDTVDRRAEREPSSRRPECAAGIAQRLGVSAQVVEDCIEELIRAGVLGPELLPRNALRVDTRREPTKAVELRMHWARAGLERLARPEARDLFSFNVFSISREGYEQIRQLQLEFFRRVQALVGESSTPEVGALLTIHLTRWEGLD